MSTNCLGIILSSATLIVSSLGILFGWKWHKDSKRQNLEQELARIEIELKEIDAQQADADARGAAATQHIIGANVPNPYGGVSFMLELKKQALLDRKAKIKKQLQQL
jgi:predicted negative regulator of RcsB-dependent stress response